MQRSPRLRVVFALSWCLVICCLPDALGQKTYKQSTIGEELTAEELRYFQLYHVLPPRFQYSTKHGAYIETTTAHGGGGGRGTAAAKDEGNHEGQVLMPRWQAMLRQLAPSMPSLGSLPSLESLSKMASWPSRGSPATHHESADDAESEPDQPGSDADQPESATEQPESAAAAHEPAPAPAQGSGMLGSLADYWMNMQDTVTGYGQDAFGYGDDGKADDGKADGEAAEEAGPGLMASTYNKAKDVATSDMGQEAIKFALGFLPGGGSAVKAYETGNKLYSMSSKADDVADKIPDLP